MSQCPKLPPPDVMIRAEYPFARPDKGATKEWLPSEKGSGNVFTDLGFDDAEAQSLQRKADAIERAMKAHRMMADAIGVKAKVNYKQPRAKAR
jgi:hypothetical protein